MPYKIEEVKVLSVGTTPQTLELGYQGFVLENNSPANTLYFRDMECDGAESRADNAFALGPGERLETVLSARSLSLLASGEGTDVRVLILELG